MRKKAKNMKDIFQTFWGRTSEQNKFIGFTLFLVSLIVFAFLFGYGIHENNLFLIAIGFLGSILSLSMVLYIEETLTDWRKGEIGFSGWDYIVLFTILIVMIILIIFDLKGIKLF